MKKFLISEQEKQQIKKLYGILSEQSEELSQYNDVEASIYDEKNKINYEFKVEHGKLKQYVKDPATNKKYWQVIEKGSTNYDYGLNLIKKEKASQESDEQSKKSIESNSRVVMGCDRNKEEYEFIIPNNLTTEDMQIIYNQSKDYNNEREKERKLNPGKPFCAGDLFDFNLYQQKPETLKECGILNYSTVLFDKVPDRQYIAPIAECIYSLVNFQDKECAARVGIKL